jgi:hypothetical protein
MEGSGAPDFPALQGRRSQPAAADLRAIEPIVKESVAHKLPSVIFQLPPHYRPTLCFALCLPMSAGREGKRNAISENPGRFFRTYAEALAAEELTLRPAWCSFFQSTDPSHHGRYMVFPVVWLLRVDRGAPCR